MARRVLSRMKQQAQCRRGKAGPPDETRRGKFVQIGGFQLIHRPLHDSRPFGKQIGQRWTILVQRPLGGHLFPLGWVEFVPTRVTEEPIQRSRQVRQVKPDRRRIPWTNPESLDINATRDPADFIVGLYQRMSHRLQESRNAGDRTSEPRFGRGRCHLLTLPRGRTGDK